MDRQQTRPRLRPHRIADCQAGQAILWVVVMLPLFLSVVGLTADGGLVFGARRELQNVADSAARAGAMQVDQGVYRESSGSTVVLDVAAARQVAADYLVAQGSGISGRVSAGPQRVVVEVGHDAPTSFLRIVRINTVRITAMAQADVRHGIERANR